jgi:predicted DNA-binding transcriptional regulator YafY
MRADRLVAILLLLQSRQRVTAQELAGELEVSVRTARRDLDALSAAGVPVYSQPGRGGGWMLVGGARTDLSGLTATEARTLFMVAGPSAAATPELKAALRKLVRALPEPFRRTAETAAASVIVDPGGWDQSRRSAWTPSQLDPLQAATAAGEQVILGYAARDGAATTRVVSPLGLARKGEVWYLLAQTAAGLRTFRVGRVTSVEPTGEPVQRPPDFDLEQAWKAVVARVDELRSPVQVAAVVDPDILPMLRWVLDRRVRIGAAGGDGRVAVTIVGPHVEAIAGQIAGFGGRIEVLSPVEVRDRLAGIGRELAATYS